MTLAEAEKLISKMKDNAKVAPAIKLTPENWEKELFIKGGFIVTPVGCIKLGENQYAKLNRLGREGKLGMVNMTLTDPDFIVKDKSKARGDKPTEREFSYVFVRAFLKEDGTRFYYFTTVSAKIDGLEIVVSLQEKSINRIKNLLRTAELAYMKGTLSNESIPNKGQPVSETQDESSVSLDDSRTTTKAEIDVAPLGINSSVYYEGKGSEKSDTSK